VDNGDESVPCCGGNRSVFDLYPEETEELGEPLRLIRPVSYPGCELAGSPRLVWSSGRAWFPKRTGSQSCPFHSQYAS